MSNDSAPRVSGETYFFRDHGQFDLLRLRLLPELIERRRATRALRLWSAGCSTGEEAYSLAILVDMLLPERESWDILILGSDNDPAALAKAQRGIYRQWSFRLVPDALQRRYFQRKDDTWALDERISRMVSFRAGDLIGDSFSDARARNMDLILCRNVLIYFAESAVALIADKLAAALSEGGYLMTGHTDLIGHSVRVLRSRLFAEGVVYQRAAAVPANTLKPTRIAPPPFVPRPAPSVAPPAAPGQEDLLAKARQFADRGEYGHAELACRQALAVAPLAPGPYFLLAQLAQLRGDFQGAGALLDKTLYLDPGNVAACLEQAALCERADNLPRARTLRRAALEIVRALPGDAVVEPYDTSAAEMAQWLT